MDAEYPVLVGNETLADLLRIQYLQALALPGKKGSEALKAVFLRTDTLCKLNPGDVVLDQFRAEVYSSLVDERSRLLAVNRKASRRRFISRLVKVLFPLVSTLCWILKHLLERAL